MHPELADGYESVILTGSGTAAVEAMLKVEVKSVQIVNVGGKTKRFGRFTGSLRPGIAFLIPFVDRVGRRSVSEGDLPRGRRLRRVRRPHAP